MPELKPVFSLPDAKDLILEGALAAFAEFGFHGASMRDIAGRAGVSQSLVHHHFGGKEALWNFVGERISADFLDYMAEAISADFPARDYIPRAMRGYLAYWREHPAAFRFNLWRLLEGPKGERQARSTAINTRAVPLFERGQKEGFIRKDMPAGMAMIVSGSLIQFWLHSQTEIGDALGVTGADLPTDDDFVEQILALVGAEQTRRPQGKKRKSK